MAYARFDSSSPNPPAKVYDRVGSSVGGGFRQWVYVSTHIQTEVGTSDFISDGQALGMKAGDSVLVRPSTVYVTSHHTVTAVGTTYTSLTAGLVISSAS